ncbi:YfhJ family protein [Bacillus solimangrovi]|uniref:WVELL protein n=1 Tax=Bacillus solimangrovi TaxID=1305675 RepID=A0A1E5LBC0_9BACI|nr:YfhJ family protein [Bacillus solimangrovi]OEH91390.1 hypothetical protein BFG57_05860 [Bacillus solimangrovi]
MEEVYELLTEELLKVNRSLSYDKARTWIEILWEDFESTRAKAGRKYRGQEMTEQIVRHWISNYGPRLHEFLATNPKYKHLLEDEGLIQ